MKLAWILGSLIMAGLSVYFVITDNINSAWNCIIVSLIMTVKYDTTK